MDRHVKWLRRRIVASIATQSAETFAVVAVASFALMYWRTSEGPLTSLLASVVIAQLVTVARLGHAMRNNPLNYVFMRKFVDRPFTYRVSRFQGEEDTHPAAEHLPGFAPVATIRDADADPEPVFDIYHDPSRLVAASVSRASGSVSLTSSLDDGRLLVTDARALPPHERLVVSLADDDDVETIIATHRRAVSARSDVVELASSAHQVALDVLNVEYEAYLGLGPTLSSFLDLEPGKRSPLRLSARIKPAELVGLPVRLGPDLPLPKVPVAPPAPSPAHAAALPILAARAALQEDDATDGLEVPQVVPPRITDPQVGASAVPPVVAPHVATVHVETPQVEAPQVVAPQVVAPQIVQLAEIGPTPFVTREPDTVAMNSQEPITAEVPIVVTGDPARPQSVDVSAAIAALRTDPEIEAPTLSPIEIIPAVVPIDPSDAASVVCITVPEPVGVAPEQPTDVAPASAPAPVAAPVDIAPAAGEQTPLPDVLIDPPPPPATLAEAVVAAPDTAEALTDGGYAPVTTSHNQEPNVHGRVVDAVPAFEQPATQNVPMPSTAVLESVAQAPGNQLGVQPSAVHEPVAHLSIPDYVATPQPVDAPDLATALGYNEPARSRPKLSVVLRANAATSAPAPISKRSRRKTR